MEENKEQEPQKPVKEVSLGEEFHLFDPETTRRYPRGREIGWRGMRTEFDGFASKIMLNIENGKQVPVTISTLEANASTEWRLITPFNPKLGYQFTREDYNLQDRIKKMQGLATRKQIGSDAPLSLGIRAYPNSQEIKDLLIKRLRVQLKIEGDRFEAMPEHFMEPEFYYFYPAFTGPLPTILERPYGIVLPPTYTSDTDINNINFDVNQTARQSGHSLFLPSDIKKLNQIRAKFVLADEQPRDPEIASDAMK